MSDGEVRLELKTAEQLRQEVFALVVAKTLTEARVAELEAEVARLKEALALEHNARLTQAVGRQEWKERAEKAEAEVARLTKDRDYWWSAFHTANGDNARLRQALSETAVEWDGLPHAGAFAEFAEEVVRKAVRD